MYVMYIVMYVMKKLIKSGVDWFDLREVPISIELNLIMKKYDSHNIECISQRGITKD